MEIEKKELDKTIGELTIKRLGLADKQTALETEERLRKPEFERARLRTAHTAELLEEG